MEICAWDIQNKTVNINGTNNNNKHNNDFKKTETSPELGKIKLSPYACIHFVLPYKPLYSFSIETVTENTSIIVHQQRKPFE